ncbi:MAG: hypothetical protein V1706_07630 [Pseudomonadota bacterium]
MADIPKNALVYSGWVEHPAGYEYTRSERIIRHMMKWLVENRLFVTVLHKDYQSGGTLVIDVNDKTVILDKPRDWPGSHATARVVFRNATKLWCHFTGVVTATKADSLQLKFPEELFMLQRRKHYRINLPDGSNATFLYNQKKCKLNIEDLSAGGMLLYTKDGIGLPEPQHTIKNIIITVPSDEKAADSENELLRFKVKEAEVVRLFRNETYRTFCLGVNFSLSSGEEERIMKYIRQRELALLRKAAHE